MRTQLQEAAACRKDHDDRRQIETSTDPVAALWEWRAKQACQTGQPICMSPLDRLSGASPQLIEDFNRTLPQRAA